MPEQTGKFCQLLYDRRILGVLSLMKKYGTVAVEDVCATAPDIGLHEYCFVRRYAGCILTIFGTLPNPVVGPALGSLPHDDPCLTKILVEFQRFLRSA